MRRPRCGPPRSTRHRAAERPSAVFVNPGKSGEVFWDLVSDTMRAAARQLEHRRRDRLRGAQPPHPARARPGDRRAAPRRPTISSSSTRNPPRPRSSRPPTRPASRRSCCRTPSPARRPSSSGAPRTVLRQLDRQPGARHDRRRRPHGEGAGRGRRSQQLGEPRRQAASAGARRRRADPELDRPHRGLHRPSSSAAPDVVSTACCTPTGTRPKPRRSPTAISPGRSAPASAPPASGPPTIRSRSAPSRRSRRTGSCPAATSAWSASTGRPRRSTPSRRAA